MRVEARESFPRLHKIFDDLMLNTACPVLWVASWGKKGPLLVMARHRVDLTIAAGQTKDLNIDFDACASIVSEGKGKGRFRLKPVLHAGEVTLTSTSINGMVIDRATGQPISGGVTVVA